MKLMMIHSLKVLAIGSQLYRKMSRKTIKVDSEMIDRSTEEIDRSTEELARLLLRL